MAASIPVRRSTRVNIGCPVRISGVLANRMPFAEDARIVTVSKFGAKLRTQIPLQVGMHLKVAPLRGTKSGVFKVVWIGRTGTPRAGEVGVEHGKETASILGVSFPDQDLPVK